MIDSFYDGIIKLIIAISTGFLGIIPGIDGNDANFTNTDIYVRNNQIYISTRIENEFNKRIDDIIKSGRKVTLEIAIESFEENAKKSSSNKKIYKTVQYDILNKRYEVSYTETEPDLIEYFDNAEKMWIAFLKIENQSIFNAKDFSQKSKYYLNITAHLDTELEIGGKRLDIMLFWNNKVPQYKSEMFDNSIFSF